MQTVLRRGQTVYAADGTHLGSVLQCDSRFIVVGQSRWASDHVVLPVEDIAASGPDLLVLRTIATEVRAETAERWSHAPDPSGNANGVDLEPLRAGMAEIEDEAAGIGAPTAHDAAHEPGPLLLPSPEDAWELERARVARLDSEVDRCIDEEIADLERGAACEVPTVAAEPRAPSLADALSGPTHRLARPFPAGAQGATLRPDRAPATRAAMKATRSTREFERILHRAGFSRAEARAIAAGGFPALASLVERLRGAHAGGR